LVTEQRSWLKLRRVRLGRVHKLLARLLGRLALACGVDSEVASTKSRDPSLNVAMIPTTCNQDKDPVDTLFLNLAFLHRPVKDKGGHHHNVVNIHQDTVVLLRDNIRRGGIHLSSRVSNVAVLLRGTCHDLDFPHLTHMWGVGRMLVRRVLHRCRVNGDNHSRDQVVGLCSSRGRDSRRGIWDQVVGLCSIQDNRDSSRGIWDRAAGHPCSIQGNRGSSSRGRDFLQMPIQDSIRLVDKGHLHSSSSNRGRQIQRIILPGTNE